MGALTAATPVARRSQSGRRASPRGPVRPGQARSVVISTRANFGAPCEASALIVPRTDSGVCARRASAACAGGADASSARRDSCARPPCCRTRGRRELGNDQPSGNSTSRGRSRAALSTVWVAGEGLTSRCSMANIVRSEIPPAISARRLRENPAARRASGRYVLGGWQSLVEMSRPGIDPSQQSPIAASSFTPRSPHDLLRFFYWGGEDRLGEVWTGVIGYWIGDVRRAAETATAVAEFEQCQRHAQSARRDPRILPAALAGDHAAPEKLTRLASELERRANAARTRLDRDFADGLRSRIGTYIAPQAVVDLYPRDGDAMYAFALVRDLRRAVTPTLPNAACVEAGPTRLPLLAMTAAEMPPGLAVCEGCTIVFEPRRKAHARYCGRCEKRPPIRASFLTHVPRRGESVPLRVPQLARGQWLDRVERWRSVYVGCCVGCGGYFVSARKHARTCPGSKRCEAKHRRRESPACDSAWEREQ